MSDLRIGDVVVLNSGGPKMTIEEIGQYGLAGATRARCQWFNEKHEITNNLFPLESLSKED